MADQERTNNKVVDLRKKELNEDTTTRLGAADYLEETSAEMTAPVSFERRNNVEDRKETEASGRGIGFAALILSIISLFVAPILFGAAGIVLGFVARRRGAQGLGSWAIGIGAVSIIVGIFILPFF